jgi:hypothetical protein
VSTELASSSSNIYLNLVTKEERQYTVELTSQGFRVSIPIQWVSKNLVSSMQLVVFTVSYNQCCGSINFGTDPDANPDPGIHISD